MKVDKHFYNDQYKKNQESKHVLDRSWYKYFVKYAKGRNDVIADFFKKHIHQKDLNILDLGCGSGGLYHLISGGSYNYIGMDISDYNLGKIAPHKNDTLQLIEKNLNDDLTEIKDLTQDVVISISTIEYLFDPYHFIKESNRVLKNGGTLVLHTMNFAFLPRRIQLLLGKLPTFNNATGRQGGILHNFTYSTLKNLLIESEFEIIDFKNSGLLNNLRTWRPNLLCGDLIFICKKKGKGL